MSKYKEIVTKAVIGKAKKVSNADYSLRPDENPNTVLGCWVINHTFSGSNNNGEVLINGGFDVNVWFSYDSDTKTTVVTRKFNYTEKMKVHLKDNLSLTDNSEIIVRSLKQPTVTDVKLNEGIINLNIEKELGVEIIGDTKIKVSIEDDEDEYEVIVDEIDSETTEKALDSINEDYLS